MVWTRKSKMTKYAFIVCSLFFLAPSHATPLFNDTDLEGLSKKTVSILNRYDGCLHFAGEFSGEPALDIYVKQQFKKLGCETIDHDVSLLRHRSYQNPKVVKALQIIEDEYQISR